MSDEIPDFDPTNVVIGPGPFAKPERKKPARRRKLPKKVPNLDRSAAIRMGKAKAKKRKVAKKARRGRPPGSTNKPKAGERLIASVRRTSAQIRKAIIVPAVDLGDSLQAYLGVQWVLDSVPAAERRVILTMLLKELT